MENSYGIGVSNRYALFYDDDADPLEILKAQEQEKEEKKRKKSTEKENRGKPVTTQSNVSAKPPKVTALKTEKKPTKETSAQPKGLDHDKERGGKSEKGQENNRVRSNRGERPVERTFNKFNRVERGDGESREERNNRRNREDRPERPDRPYREDYRESGPPPRFEKDGEFRGRGRGRGGRGRGGTGRGRGFAFDGRGKREFDRQSGSDKTGVKPTEKKEGSGAYNWGKATDDLEVNEWNTVANTSDEQDWEGNSAPPASAPANVEEIPKTEKSEEESGMETQTGETEEAGGEKPATTDEDQQKMTLDEWKAMQTPRQKPIFNIRKPNEGEDPKMWKNTTVLKKKEEDASEEEEEEEADEEDPGHRGRQKQIVEIEITFSDPPVRRGGGMGRGGRGGRGMRGGRGGGGGTGGSSGGGIMRGGRGGMGGPGAGSSERGRGGMNGETDGGARGRRGTGRGGSGFGTFSSNRTPRQSAPRVDDENDFPSLE